MVMQEMPRTEPKPGLPHLGGPACYGSYAVTKRIATIEQTLDLKGRRILDLGCGNGCYTAELARRGGRVCGIDVQMSHLEAFRESIPRVRGAGEELPFAPASFEIVTMIEVLEHTTRDDATLNECFRVLKPGGLLALFVPNKLYPFESHPCHIGNLPLGRNIPFVSWLPKFLREPLCHARIYTQRKILAMAQASGFEPYTLGYILPPIDSLRLPFKQAYRQAARWMEKSPLARFGVSIYAVFQKPAARRSSAAVDACRCGASATSPQLREQPPIAAVSSRVTTGAGSFRVLGVKIHALQIAEVVARMENWIHERGSHTIAATGMHGVMEAQHDPAFKTILNTSDLIVPDGMPLVWLGRRRGFYLPHRVYGPNLLLAFCEATRRRPYRHFFYGGAPGVAARLAESLQRRFPGLEIAGAFSPPFRALLPKEAEQIAAMISRATPDVLWVGLGTPKQEQCMHDYKRRLSVPVLVGVGAAFDMLSGGSKQAPRWMGEHGLESTFRLFQEPRRLWRRYLIYGSQFVGCLAAEALHLHNFDAKGRSPQT